MKQAIFGATVALISASVGSTAIAATPTSPLGLYIGAELGSSHVTADAPTAVGTFTIDRHLTGWNAFIGIRPVSRFGAEINYMDFGSVHLSTTPDLVHFLRADTKNSAVGVYAMGYLPIPVPHWDVFGKLGVASVNTHAGSTGDYSNVCVFNPATNACVPLGVVSASTDKHVTGFAYGVGTQYSFGSLGVRAEYQKISAQKVNPSLFSVGLTWKF